MITTKTTARKMIEGLVSQISLNDVPLHQQSTNTSVVEQHHLQYQLAKLAVFIVPYCRTFPVFEATTCPLFTCTIRSERVDISNLYLIVRVLNRIRCRVALCYVTFKTQTPSSAGDRHSDNLPQPERTF